jgi:hypothetical protein
MPDPEPEPTWTYDADFTTVKDQIRFLIGDTDESDPLLEDSEIEFMSSMSSSVHIAAAKACRAIAVKLGRQVDYSIGDLSEKLSQRAAAYLQMAMQLDADASRASFSSGVPSVGFVTDGATMPDSLRMGDEPLGDWSLNRDDAPSPYRGVDK